MSISKFFTPGKIFLFAIIAVLLFGGCGAYGYANTTRTQGMTMEQQMSAQYKANQNDLSTYVSSMMEQVDVANLKTDKMKDIMTAAVQGRYGPDGFKAGGQFFSAITEAYPDIKGTDIYDRILTAVQAGRAQFANKQDKLTDMKRAYDTWRFDGIVRSYFAGKYFPSSNLQVTVNGKKYVGAEALAMLDQQVLTEGVGQAFESGKMAPLDLRKR